MSLFPAPPRLYIAGSRVPGTWTPLTPVVALAAGISVEWGANRPHSDMEPATFGFRLWIDGGIPAPAYLRKGTRVALTQPIQLTDGRTMVVTVFAGRIGQIQSTTRTHGGYLLDVVAVDHLKDANDTYISADWVDEDDEFGRQSANRRWSEITAAATAQDTEIIFDGLDDLLDGDHAPQRVSSIKLLTTIRRFIAEYGPHMIIFDATPAGAISTVLRVTPRTTTISDARREPRDWLVLDVQDLGNDLIVWSARHDLADPYPPAFATDNRRPVAVPAAAIDADVEWTHSPGDLYTVVNWEGVNIGEFEDRPNNQTQLNDLGSSQAPAAVIREYGRHSVSVTTTKWDAHVSATYRQEAATLHWFNPGGHEWEIGEFTIIDPERLPSDLPARLLSNAERPRTVLRLDGIAVPSPSSRLTSYFGAPLNGSLQWNHAKHRWEISTQLYDYRQALDQQDGTRWSFADLEDPERAAEPEDFTAASQTTAEHLAELPADVVDPSVAIAPLTLHDFAAIRFPLPEDT